MKTVGRRPSAPSGPMKIFASVWVASIRLVRISFRRSG
jgi:hypothetical protein